MTDGNLDADIIVSGVTLETIIFSLSKVCIAPSVCRQLIRLLRG
jgi:hypothetical protein